MEVLLLVLVVVVLLTVVKLLFSQLSVPFVQPVPVCASAAFKLYENTPKNIVNTIIPINVIHCLIICNSVYLSSPLKLLDEPVVPAYNPNHAAPAPTTIEIKPLCSKLGVSSAINHIVHLYNNTI